MKLSSISFLMLLLSSTTSVSALVAPAASRRSTSTRLFLADVPQNSFPDDESASSAASMLHNSNSFDQFSATAAFGMTALAAGGAAALTLSTSSNSDLLMMDAIPQLTAQLSHWEQSLQNLLASSASEPSSMLMETLAQQLPQQLDALQHTLVAQAEAWKDTLSLQASSSSGAISTAMAHLDAVASALLQRLEAMELVVQTQVSLWQQHAHDAAVATNQQWVALQTSFTTAKDALVEFQQESILPALQAAQTAAADCVQDLMAQFQRATLDDTVTAKLQEWNSVVAQHFENNELAAAAWKASLQLKWSQMQESLIPTQMETARQLAADAVTAAQSTKDAVVAKFVQSVPHSDVAAKFYDLQDSLDASVEHLSGSAHQLVQDNFDASLHGLSDAAQETTQAVAKQVHELQENAHDSVLSARETLADVWFSTKALAAAKATADVSFQALELWLPGYTATVTAIVKERASQLYHMEELLVSQSQQAVAQELLFQLKTTLNAQLDALLLHEQPLTDMVVAQELHQQVTAAVSHLKVLQESASGNTHEALQLLTESTGEKLAVVSQMLAQASASAADESANNVILVQPAAAATATTAAASVVAGAAIAAAAMVGPVEAANNNAFASVVVDQQPISSVVVDNNSRAADNSFGMLEQYKQDLMQYSQ